MTLLNFFILISTFLIILIFESTIKLFLFSEAEASHLGYFAGIFIVLM